MRLSKIYTKIGDNGQTQLADASHVNKTCARIEAYGSVDELNAFVGLWGDTLRSDNSDGSFEELLSKIAEVQNRLFDIGGELSFPGDAYDPNKFGGVTNDDIAKLERDIDRWNEAIPPLKNFVIPGGHLGNSAAHVCRTVCRRAERRVIKLSETENVRREIMVFLNRLSDWFFVAGRHVAKLANCSENLWRQKS